MEDGGARRAVEALLATDLSVADHVDLAAASKASARLRAFADLADVQINRRVRRLAAEGDRSSDHVLIDDDRTVTWYRPDGTTWKTAPRPDRRAARRPTARPTGRASPTAA